MPKGKGGLWWIIQGSNLERTGYEPAALPIELMIHVEPV